MSKNKTDKNTRSTIIGTILGVFMLVLCIYITCQVIYGNVTNQPPSIFTLSISYVPTSSMEPNIHASDYVLFHKINYDDAKIGDIIVYYSSKEEKYIIHRVVGKVTNKELTYIDYDPALSNGLEYSSMENVIKSYHANNTSDSVSNYLITLGDNNYAIDSMPVTSDMVYGSFIRVLGFMNFLSGGINNAVVFIILIGIFLIMIALQVWSAFIKTKTEKLKKENEEKEKQLEQMRNELREEMLKELKKNPELLDSKPEEKEEPND